ncbi:transcription factor Adf-1-like [Periplaneta americana]|uniref:transcription factor Adf-1-like n=1 Tax=Periplaneta americana TaxID=6978 RepID=UPI0037E7C17E
MPANKQEKNLSLVKAIQLYPCIYDVTMPSYNRTDIKEKAWQDVSKITGESAQHCRERWKNIRTVFMRHLKQDGDQPAAWARRYYLQEAMQFLLPFLKGNKKQNETLTTSVKMEQEYPIIAEDVDDSWMQEVDSVLPETHNSVSDTSSFDRPGPSEEQADIVGEIVCQQTPKRKASETEQDFEEKRSDVECADQKFLLSILPDMKEMNSSQKRTFKRGVLELLGNILDSSSSHN